MRHLVGISLFCFALLLVLGCHKKTYTTKKKQQENKKSLAERTADAYDMYILDLPYDRHLYHNQGIRLRKMLEVSTVSLPAEEGYVVRVDSFDTQGKILKTMFPMENKLDSIVYEYQTTGQIIKSHQYYQEGDTTVTQYVYDKIGMMQQVVYFREQVTAFELEHNFNGKLTDKTLSDESPTFSPIREIYRYNSVGKMIQALKLVDNVPTEKLKRYYDRKGRVTKNERLANGVVMSSSSFIYNNDDLIAIRKDEMRFSEEESEKRVYEFVYEKYD